MPTLHISYKELYGIRDTLLKGIDPLAMKLAGETSTPVYWNSQSLNDLAISMYGYADPFAVVIALVNDLEPTEDGFVIPHDFKSILCPSYNHIKIISLRLYDFLLDKALS